MRELKFRAWNRVTKKMWWFDLMWGNMHAVGSGWIGMVDSPAEPKWSKSFFGDNRTQVDPDDCEIMQYTGLKDKQGVEIYEGDIVKAISDFVMLGTGEPTGKICTEMHKVIYMEEKACFITQSVKSHYPNGHIDKFGMNQERMTKYYEVIGNIYENSELSEANNAVL